MSAIQQELQEKLLYLEMQARELRLLLSEVPDALALFYETEHPTPESLSVILALDGVQQMIAPLLTAVRSEAYRRDAERALKSRDSAQADLDRALGLNPPSTEPTVLPRPDAEWQTWNQFTEDGPQDNRDPGPGGSLVGAIPVRPRPLRDGAGARTFSEALEPPRNP